MRNFLNVSAQESKGFHAPIYFNARKLKNEALLLAENKAYSTATSLTVLSTEELIKAILVLLHSEKYKVYRLKEAHKFFKDHAIRHHLAQLIETGVGLLEAKEKWNCSKLNKMSSNTSFIESILHALFSSYNACKPISNSKERIKKLQEFNDLKNQGFYVDYSDGLKVPIDQIPINDFYVTIEINRRIMTFYKKLRLLFHPLINKYLSEKEVINHKQDLHLFIDNALDGFLFNELKNLK